MKKFRLLSVILLIVLALTACGDCNGLGILINK